MGILGRAATIHFNTVLSIGKIIVVIYLSKFNGVAILAVNTT